MPLEVTVPNPASLPKPNALGDIPVKKEAPSALEDPISTPAAEVRLEANAEMANVRAKVTDAKAIREALKWHSHTDVANYMAQKADITLEDAGSIINDTVKHDVLIARQHGYTEEQIRGQLSALNYDNSLVNNVIDSTKTLKPWKRNAFDPNKSIPDNAEDIAVNYRNIYNKYGTYGKAIQGMWNGEKGAEARYELDQINVALLKKLQSEGIDSYLDPDSGEIMVKDKDGSVAELDEGMLKGLWAGKFELAGSFVGSVKGFNAGLKAPGASKIIAAPVGGLIGGALGATAGKGADLALSTYAIKEEISREFYLQQMRDAGIADAVIGTLGNAAFKGAVKTGKFTAKTVMKGYDYIVDGQIDAAVKYYTDMLHMSPEKATEFAKQLELISKEQLVKETRTTANKLSFGLIPTGQRELTQSEKAILAISSTQQLSEGIVAQAVAKSPRAVNALIHTIDTRAKSLQSSIAKITDANTGSLVRKDLEAYTADVKKFYKTVLAMGVEHAGSASRATDFKFDMDKLAIEPVMKNIVESVGDPTMKQRFVAYADRIANASADRSFEGLINMRQAVNDFKYSKSGLNPTDIEALNGVLNRIDTQIEKAAKQYIPDSKTWLANFGKAKTEYAKMKVFEENTMYQSIMAERNSEKGIRQAINKWANDKEVDAETFNAVAERVSPKTRSLMEVSAIENLSSKYTVGKITEFQAINFPMLAEELAGLNIKSAEGKALVNAVTDISKIFRNDVELAKVTGYIRMPNASQALSTSLIAKAKYWVMSQEWNIIKSRIPGQAGAQQALVNKTAELLKDPLKLKTVEDFIQAVPEPSRPEMRSLVKELQAATASTKTGKVDAEWRNMYKSSPSGKLVETEGVLGRGVYLFDKVVGAKPGANIVKHEVNLTKMATMEDISRIAGAPVLERDLKTLNDKAELYKRLSEAGYEGILLDGKAMLFPERTIGVNK